MISPLMFNIFNIVLNRKHIVIGHFNNIYSCILERDDQIMLIHIYSLILLSSQLHRSSFSGDCISFDWVGVGSNPVSMDFVLKFSSQENFAEPTPQPEPAGLCFSTQLPKGNCSTAQLPTLIAVLACRCLSV